MLRLVVFFILIFSNLAIAENVKCPSEYVKAVTVRADGRVSYANQSFEERPIGNVSSVAVQEMVKVLLVAVQQPLLVETTYPAGTVCKQISATVSALWVDIQDMTDKRDR